MKINRLILCMMTAVVLIMQSCVKEDSDLSIRLSSSDTVYFDDSRTFTITVNTNPSDVLNDKSAKLTLLTLSGTENALFTLNGVKKTGKGTWDLEISIANNIFKTSFAVQLDYHRMKSKTSYISVEKGDPELSSLSVDGVAATIDKDGATCQVVLPTTTDFSALQLVFAAKGEKFLLDGKEVTTGELCDFSQVRTLSIIIGNAVKEYKITVCNTGLPVVFVNTPNKSAISSKTTWKEGCSMKILNPDGSLDYEGPMSIRGRGNSTWNYPKKPYAVRLDERSKILGMPKHKRWILLAQWKDRTLLRNDAAFWLSRHSGLEYTVRGQFVELVLNGKHMGNYYLCEQIKIDKNRVAITEMPSKATDPELITGGYLMELDTYYDQPKQFKSSFNLPYMFKQPDEDDLSDEMFNYMKNYIAELEAILKDETRIKNHEYEAYLDVDSAIDYMLVEELTNNTDFYNTWPWAGIHSGYMHKDKDGKLMHGPVWDFDYHGFVPGLSYFWAGAQKTLYYPALLKDPQFRERMIQRWESQRDTWLGLSAYIDEQAEKIRLSESINHEMWPIKNNPENGDEDMTFQNAVNRIKDGFTSKHSWMNKNIYYLK